MIQDTYQTTRDLRSAIKNYGKRHGINKSEAIRRAIVSLLQSDGVEIDLPEIERGGLRPGAFGRTDPS